MIGWEITGRLTVGLDEEWQARVGRRRDGETPAGKVGSGIKIETNSESWKRVGGRRGLN